MGFSFCVDTDRTLKEPSLHAQKEKLSQSFVTLTMGCSEYGHWVIIIFYNGGYPVWVKS